MPERDINKLLFNALADVEFARGLLDPNTRKSSIIAFENRTRSVISQSELDILLAIDASTLEELAQNCENLGLSSEPKRPAAGPGDPDIFYWGDDDDL